MGDTSKVDASKTDIYKGHVALELTPLREDTCYCEYPYKEGTVLLKG